MEQQHVIGGCHSRISQQHKNSKMKQQGVAADCLRRVVTPLSHGTMSQQSVTAGCHSRMPQQDAKGRMTKRGCFDVSALSDSGMSRQDVTARCHSRQSRPRCLSVVSRQVATARCHGRLSRQNVTTGCHSAIEGCRSKMTQQRVTSR